MSLGRGHFEGWGGAKAVAMMVGRCKSSRGESDDRRSDRASSVGRINYDEAQIQFRIMLGRGGSNG